MPCTQCGDNPDIHYNLTQYDCNNLRTNKCNPIDATCVYYTGAAFSCLSLGPNKNIEEIFLNIDSLICNITGADYSGYNMACLDTDVAITTQQQFVEKISQYVCNLNTTLTNHIAETEDTTNFQPQIDAIVNPNITTCATVGITSSTNLKDILIAYGTHLCNLYSYTDISGVTWNNSFTVITNPTNVPTGFTEVLRQIGLLKAMIPSSISLPTFDTSTSCLDTKGTATTLFTTVNDIITKVCSLPNITYTDLVWGCLGNPTFQTLTSVTQHLIDSIDNLYQYSYTPNNSQFDLIDNGACNPRTLSIKTSVLEGNGKVFANPTSTVKGTLQEVLVEGTGVSFDYVSDNNKVTINSTTNDGKVAVNNVGVRDYLINKLIGSNANGISLTPNVVSDQVELDISFDDELFVNYILDTIAGNEILSAKFCNLVCGCRPCNP